MTPLTERWQTEPGRAFADKLFAVGYSGNGFTVSGAPFGTIPQSGKVDLRNLRFERSPQLRGVSINRADLTEADFDGARLERCQFDDVVFDRASLTAATEHGNQFTRCSFTGTNLNEAILGYRGSKFDSCIFRRAKFRKTLFVRSEFTKCTFDSCSLDGCDFNGSSFDECTFIGTLKGVWFRGSFALKSDCEKYGTPRLNTMRSVSFENAKLSGVTFSDDCDLSTVIPPKDGRHALFNRWPSRLEWVLQSARTWPENLRAEAELFIRSYQTHAQKQNWFLLAIDDLASELCEACTTSVWQALQDFR